jgi:hypothetical protein
MKFKVERGSDSLGEKPPCAGAVRGKDVDGLRCWHVEVADLAALVAFVGANGQCVISDRREPALLIYDAYLE